MPAPTEKEVDLKRTYDAVIVGSGAAGGMAAHVLTSHGMKILLLEAGKKLDIEKELKSMQWPYEHPRRGGLPPDSHALTHNEYTFRKPPYAKGLPNKHVYSYVEGWTGADYSKNIVVEEKDNPYTGSNYAWVRARCLGGKTNIWGRLRCGCPITISKLRRATDTARIGPFPTPTSRRITTRWTCISASPGTKRICRTCPIASSSDPRA